MLSRGPESLSDSVIVEATVLAQRITTAKQSLEILKGIHGKPWTALPMFSPGYRTGRRCADKVVELTNSLRDLALSKGK